MHQDQVITFWLDVAALPLTQLIEDMNGRLIESKKAVASVIAEEKQLERQLLRPRIQAEDWEKRAVMAVQEGEPCGSTSF